MDTPPPPPPAATPVPPAALSMSTERDRLVLARAPLRVSGRLSPAAQGDRVVVRARSGGRVLASRSVPVDAAGAYRARLLVPRHGTVTVRASHAGTPRAAASRPVRVDVLPRRVRAGARGLAVRLVQRHLAARGYVVGRRGRFDARTARAVLAFRKVSGLPRTTSAGLVVLRRLAAGGGRFRVRFASHGRHVEADLSRQVLVLARGRRVERIYHTSSGTRATPTIRGSFRFTRSEPGLNVKEMFWSRYFIRGYAIHGYKSVPVYPASHGCLRVPLADAVSIYRWIRIGERIDVYA